MDPFEVLIIGPDSRPRGAPTGPPYTPENHYHIDRPPIGPARLVRGLADNDPPPALARLVLSSIPDPAEWDRNGYRYHYWQDKGGRLWAFRFIA